MARPNVDIGNQFPSKVDQDVLNWVIEVAQFMIQFQLRHDRVASEDSIDNYNIKLERRGRGKRNVFLSVLGYTPFALAGRKAGGMPPPSAMTKWIEEKGLIEEFGGDDNIVAAGWAIAKKIEAEGTLSGTGPDDTKLNPGLVAATIANTGKKHLANIGDGLAKNVADSLFKRLSTGKGKRLTI